MPVPTPDRVAPPLRFRASVSTHRIVLDVLDEVLSLDGRARAFDADTALLGAVAELDSMAVVSIVTTLEERFGFYVDDEDLSADDFVTVGALVAFVDRQRGA